jgi:hypothetical protein
LRSAGGAALRAVSGATLTPDNVGLEAESPPALRAVDISSPSLEVGFVSFVRLRDGTSCRRVVVPS